jgi:hypothetical protein
MCPPNLPEAEQDMLDAYGWYEAQTKRDPKSWQARS